jgi:hypothetical protein
VGLSSTTGASADPRIQPITPAHVDLLLFSIVLPSAYSFVPRFPHLRCLPLIFLPNMTQSSDVSPPLTRHSHRKFDSRNVTSPVSRASRQCPTRICLITIISSFDNAFLPSTFRCYAVESKSVRFTNSVAAILYLRSMLLHTSGSHFVRYWS